MAGEDALPLLMLQKPLLGISNLDLQRSNVRQNIPLHAWSQMTGDQLSDLSCIACCSALFITESTEA